MEQANVAVVGATGAVGEVMLEMLEERQFPIKKIYPLASERSAGTAIRFNGRSTRVESLADFDFGQVDIALFSAGGSVSAEFAPKAAEAGCVVIDNTSYFRREPDIPLIVPRSIYIDCSITRRGKLSQIPTVPPSDGRGVETHRCSRHQGY